MPCRWRHNAIKFWTVEVIMNTFENNNKISAQNEIDSKKLDYFINQRDHPVFHSFSLRYFYWLRREQITNRLKRVVACGFKILDVGCGEGDILFYLKKHSLIKDYYSCGIDASEISVGIALDRNALINDPQIELKVMDANKIDYPSNTFDVVICLEVIEHIKEPDKVIREIARVLKAHGIAFFSTPNNENRIIRSLIKPFRKYFSNNDTNIPEISSNENIETYGHISLKNIRTWKKIMKDNGFSTVKIDGTGSVLFGRDVVDRHRIIFSFAVLWDSIFGRLPLSYLWTELVLFECKK